MLLVLQSNNFLYSSDDSYDNFVHRTRPSYHTFREAFL